MAFEYSKDCPSDLRLTDFLRGSLEHHEIDAIGDHLDRCHRCQERAEVLSGDLERLPSEDDSELERAISAKQALIMQLAGLLEPVDDPSILGMLRKFIVLDLVAYGGMGIVLRGHDPDLKRDVAIKVLSPNLAAHGEARERFLREAQSAASIDHEHVMPIFAVVRDAALPYLVMPLNEGGSLQDRLDSDESFTIEEIVSIGTAVASALAAAHAQGLIHRDIKPANILLEQGSGKVRLTDFGVARAAEAPELTRTGLLAGTPAYMAPEQIDGEDVDQRADLFGLGAVLYTLVTGKNPFEATTTTATIKKIAMDRPKPLTNANGYLPDGFRNLVGQLLEKLPQDRPQSAEDVVQRLQDIVDGRTLGGSKKRLGLSFLNVAFVTLIVFAAVLAWHTLVDRRSPEERRAASQADLQLASERYASQNYQEGMALLCRALRTDPDNSEAAQLLVNELVYRPLPRDDGTEANVKEPLKPYVLDAKVRLEDIQYPTLGDRLMAFDQDHRIHFWLTETFEPELPAMRFPAGAIPVSQAKEAQVWTFYWNGNKSYWFISPQGFGFHASPIGMPESHACAVISSDADKLIAGGMEGGVYLWDVSERELIYEWHLHDRPVTEIVVSQDESLAVSISEDGTGVVLDLQSGKAVGAPLVHEGPIRSLALHQERRLIATGSSDNTARLWRLDDGQPVTPPLRHAVNCPDRGILVRFADAGDRLFTAGSNDHTLRIWDIHSGEPDAPSLNHPAVVSALAIDPSGGRFATGCADGSVRAWGLESLRLLAPTLTLPNAIDFVTFSNTNQLAAATDTGLVHVYDLAPHTLSLTPAFLEFAEAIAGRRDDGEGNLVAVENSDLVSLRDRVVTESTQDVSARVVTWLSAEEAERERSPLRAVEGEPAG